MRRLNDSETRVDDSEIFLAIRFQRKGLPQTPAGFPLYSGPGRPLDVHHGGSSPHLLTAPPHCTSSMRRCKILFRFCSILETIEGSVCTMLEWNASLNSSNRCLCTQKRGITSRIVHCRENLYLRINPSVGARH